MVQAETLVPGRTFLNTVLQAPGIITQSMQGRQLVIRYGRVLHQSVSLLSDRDYLRPVKHK
ncbi:hypothetical protein D3C71_1289900 [compost metagenome]